MKELGSLIPCVFYDLIGRLIPGFTVIASTYIACVGPTKAAAALDSFLKLGLSGSSVLVVLLLMGLASYVLAMILSGVARWVNLRDWLDWRLARKCQENTEQPGKDPSPVGSGLSVDVSDASKPQPDIDCKYDYIKYLDPVIADRLTKVKSERNSCEKLITGWAALFIANPFFSLCGSTAQRIMAVEGVLILLILAVDQQRQRLERHYRRRVNHFHKFLTDSSAPPRRMRDG